MIGIDGNSVFDSSDGLGGGVFPIVENRFLGPEIKHFRVLAPRIARKRRAGQFVIVRLEARHAHIIYLSSKREMPARGDIVSGAATVILAMGAGRAAAKTIHEFLATGNWQRAKLIAGQIDRRTNWKKER